MTQPKLPEGEKSKEEILNSFSHYGYMDAALQAMTIFADQGVKKAECEKDILITLMRDDIKTYKSELQSLQAYNEKLVEILGQWIKWTKADWPESLTELCLKSEQALSSITDKTESLQPSGGGWSDEDMKESFSAGQRFMYPSGANPLFNEWLSSYKKNPNK